MRSLLLTLVGASSLALSLNQASADTLCGHYTDPTFPEGYYEGSNPKADKAGYKGCWYAGFGLGVSRLAPTGNGNNWYVESDDYHNLGYDFYLGRRFTQNWFAEIKYADLGEVALTNPNTALANQYPDAAIAYTAPSFMLGFQLNPNKRFKPFVKFGVSGLKAKSIDNGNTAEVVTDFETQAALGLGFDWTIGEKSRSPWFVRFSAEEYDEDAWYMSLGLARYLGATKPKQRPAPKPKPAPKPEPKPEPVVEKEPVYIPVIDCSRVNVALHGVNFKLNSSELTDSAKNVLAPMLKVLLEFSEVKVEVQAHTDSSGSAQYNLALSNLRARSVVGYFRQMGVKSSQLQEKGFGETLPIANNDTKDGRAMNRRVEFKVLNDEVCIEE